MFSLERVFAEVRSYLPADVRPAVAGCPRKSQGVLNRLVNILWARRNQSDVNHVTGDVHYVTYLLRKRRTVLTIADCAPLERFRGLKRFLLWFFWYWLPEKRCRRITVISEFTKTRVLAHLWCSPEKIEVVHCPVPDGFTASPRPFDSERPVVLQVGTGWNKNVERVAEALQGVSCRLEILGPLSKTQRALLTSGGVDFHDQAELDSEALMALYRRCDLVVFASLYEGFGLPILEAQATGRPVVTSDRCSMPEVAGEAACLVDPESVESIRAGILRVIHDREFREALVRKGFENVERFAPDRVAGRYAAIYRQMATS